jgi:uncharacterized protein (DUF305 family)
MNRSLTSLLAFGVLSLLPLAACSTTTSAQNSTEATETASSETAQMDHEQMDRGQMDHGSMNQPNGAAMDHAMSMDLGPADETFDLRFIDAMMLHHQGAVEMAEEALQKSDRDEIRTLAQDIIAAQQTEIAQMQQWRQAWYPEAGDQPVMYHAEMGHMMPMSEAMKSSMMMSMDLGAGDEEFDLRFINAMIPHHEGALVMAEEALQKSDRLEVQELAQAILDTQQVEIDQMQQWQQAWYGQ